MIEFQSVLFRLYSVIRYHSLWCWGLSPGQLYARQEPYPLYYSSSPQTRVSDIHCWSGLGSCSEQWNQESSGSHSVKGGTSEPFPAPSSAMPNCFRKMNIFFPFEGFTTPSKRPIKPGWSEIWGTAVCLGAKGNSEKGRRKIFKFRRHAVEE